MAPVIGQARPGTSCPEFSRRRREELLQPVDPRVWVSGHSIWRLDNLVSPLLGYHLGPHLNA